MSPRQVHPFRARHHEEKSAEVLARYQRASGDRVSLPVPVDLIIETVYDLRIESKVIPEEPGERILGVLQPAARTIFLNQRHEDLFTAVVGPEQFTLGHELGHWIYDADDPAQGRLFDPAASPVFCRHLANNAPQEAAQLREVNANKFASALLMPEHLIRIAIAEPFVSRLALSQTAASWGVSAQALTIRLETLKMEWCLPNLGV